MTEDKKLVIAIDGHAGCGKSTTAKAVAARLGYRYIDTGAMYRAVTLHVLRKGIDPTDATAVAGTLGEVEVGFRPREGAAGQDTFLNGENVEGEIRNAQVTQNVSKVSAVKSVRHKLVEEQQRLGAAGGVVMDGRDIGTVVFPEADVKLFMRASLRTRAERRLQDYRQRGNEAISLEDVQRSLEERDRLDMSREESPLTQAEDAIVIDTTCLDFEEQVARALAVIETKRQQERAFH